MRFQGIEALAGVGLHAVDLPLHGVEAGVGLHFQGVEAIPHMRFRVVVLRLQGVATRVDKVADVAPGLLAGFLGRFVGQGGIDGGCAQGAEERMGGLLRLPSGGRRGGRRRLGGLLLRLFWGGYGHCGFSLLLFYSFAAQRAFAAARMLRPAWVRNSSDASWAKPPSTPACSRA